jgi:hypothetical protein
MTGLHKALQLRGCTIIGRPCGLVALRPTAPATNFDDGGYGCLLLLLLLPC